MRGELSLPVGERSPNDFAYVLHIFYRVYLHCPKNYRNIHIKKTEPVTVGANATGMSGIVATYTAVCAQKTDICTGIQFTDISAPAVTGLVFTYAEIHFICGTVSSKKPLFPIYHNIHWLTLFS